VPKKPPRDRSILYAAEQEAGTLYNPSDVEESYHVWGATCGPAALAAVLGREVSEVRDLFPEYRGYVNPTMMWGALRLAGRPAEKSQESNEPGKGLLFIQYTGPWTAPGVPPKAAYKHSHWIGIARNNDGLFAYDANAREWITFEDWQTNVITELLAHHKNATGWYAKMGIRVLV
jgi:hypothetical protein